MRNGTGPGCRGASGCGAGPDDRARPGVGLNAQPMEVSHHIGLHTLQMGPGLGHALGGRDIHLVTAAVTGAAVDKGKLERQRAVKVMEERTPAAKDGRLILGGRYGIVDVLVFHGFCINAAGELAHTVWVHGDIRNRLPIGLGQVAKHYGIRIVLYSDFP